MKTAVLLAALASIALSGGVAPAASPNVSGSTNQDMVTVAIDVTKSADYQITYTAYDDSDNVISKTTVAPKRGSLVAFRSEPRFEAIAKHDRFIVPSSNKSQLSKQLNALHQQVYNDLNANPANMAAASVSPFNTTCGTSRVDAQGSFTAGGSVVHYDIRYNTANANCQINPTIDYIWQQSGGTTTNYFTEINWDNFDYQHPHPYPTVPVSSGPSGSLPVGIPANWYGPAGDNFTTYVQGNDFFGTLYSGWTALY